MARVESIPFKTFKERIRLVKALEKKAKIEICEGYLYIEYREVTNE